MDENIANEEVMSKRQLLTDRMKGKYPDKEFADDEELYGSLYDDFTDYDERIKRNEEVDGQLTGLFNDNPQFATAFLGALSGNNPVLELVKAYGDDFRTYLEDPENAEQLAEATKSYSDRMSQEKELEAQYQKNLEKSLAIADELQAQYGEEQIDEAFTAIIEDASRAIMGDITKEMLEMRLKGMNHDADVQEAAQDASVQAKNEKIVAKKKSLKQDLPMIEGKGAAPKRQIPKSVSSLDRMTKRSDNIYKGMKRSD